MTRFFETERFFLPKSSTDGGAVIVRKSSSGIGISCSAAHSCEHRVIFSLKIVCFEAEMKGLGLSLIGKISVTVDLN